MDEKRISEIVQRVRSEGRDALTEVEGLGLLEALGIDAPRHHFVRGSGEVPTLKLFPGERAVVKVISPEILHKTEVGGVAIVPNRIEEIAAAMAAMERKFSSQRVDGYTVNEFVPYEPRLGHEMIVGMRFAKDFGPIVSFGPGGIYTEFLASTFKPGAANVFFSPAISDRATLERELSRNAVTTLVAGGLRGTRPAIEAARIVDVVETFVGAAPVLSALGVLEFEVNPFVIAGKASEGNARLLALDVLVKVGEPGGESPKPGASRDLGVVDGRIVNLNQGRRPLAKIDNLLRPASAAVIGVSEKGMNNGRIILRNLIENGFDRTRLYVVKAGSAEIDGCRCVPDVASLPEKVDLFVLVIPASQAPQCITEIAETDKAQSVIVIPGGLEEKTGTEAIVARMRSALENSRGTRETGGGPLLNGGNCLGVRSVPGKYNTLFIPEYKLPMPKGGVAPVAVVSQSGAFAICRISKHPLINPKYVITCGNQMDVTIGDYLERLADDPGLEIFAVYVEGFKPLDGEKTLRACRKIVDSGRTVIFYRAGRTAAGAAASASHTASIAGDYPVTRSLLRQIGVIVAESLDEFDDELTTFALLRGKKATGRRLGAVSNAGFECVAVADNLGALQLASFAAPTATKLEAAFAEARISEIVDVHNPIDLTPMAGDGGYDASFRAVMEDPNVDCGIVGDVPLTVAMNSLALDPGVHGEDVTKPDALPARYSKLMTESDKPWVVVVDVGDLYDPLVREFERLGIPVFRTADRALKMLNVWIDARLGK
ncbi:MAG TPA: acetate--CoA ligase family protein [Rectinemataceae bacterium]|nr:acetate--CoA ligase family protein [Rectinemataceae bacterium]